MHKKAIKNTAYALAGIILLLIIFSVGISAVNSSAYTPDQIFYNALLAFTCGHGQFLYTIFFDSQDTIVSYWATWLLVISALPLILFTFYIYKAGLVTLLVAVLASVLIYTMPTFLYIVGVVKYCGE